MTKLVSAIRQFWRRLGFDVEVTSTAGVISSNLFRGLPRNADAKICSDGTLPMRVWIASTEVLDTRKNPETVA